MTIRDVLVIAAAATMAASCSSGGEADAKDPGKGPAVVTDDTARPDKLVQLKGAEYVKVSGLPDAAAEKRVNQALHGPIDWAVGWAGGTLLPEQRAECKGKSSIVQTKVRFGLRKQLVSTANAIQIIPCYEGEGGLPTVTVTVDTKTGKALTADDVFAPKTLEKDGLKSLWDKLSGPKDDWKDCELDPLDRKDFFPGKRDGDPMESPAPAGPLLTPQGLELIWSTTGTDCNNFTFTAPYDKIKDLLNPTLHPHLPTSGT
ncbi:hypothetical protein [Spirillospora sp. CA-294931]|uniref:hypothetical protein n=1 Tax=Spirillospora sp. CA-294931 TaxID=3240042 RepID=UPI003D8ECA3B